MAAPPTRSHRRRCGLGGEVSTPNQSKQSHRPERIQLRAFGIGSAHVCFASLMAAARHAGQRHCDDSPGTAIRGGSAAHQQVAHFPENPHENDVPQRGQVLADDEESFPFDAARLIIPGGC